MNNETRNCQNCKKEFAVEPEDFDFYEKMKVPPPTWCPECRLLRKVLWRSDIGFYRRPDSRTGEMIFAGYPETAPIKVWKYEDWMSDVWDPMDYGQDYDFKRPFFEQFGELIQNVPWPALAVETMVNSPYCNNASGLKNSYMTFGASYSEDSFYSFGLARSKNIFDSSYLTDCELNYQGVFNQKCYLAFFSNYCKDSSDIYFCDHCSNVNNCFGCVDLRNRSYCIFNVQKSKEEYNDFIKKAGLNSHRSLEEWKEKANAFWMKYPRRSMWGANNVNVSGENINNSKNVHDSFLIDDGENLKFCDFLYVGTARDSYDHFRYANNSELVYDCLACGSNISKIRFSINCYPDCDNMDYCIHCLSGGDLFGCIGLRHKRYCILNKQYSKEEYEALLPKIKKHMDDTPYIDKQGIKYPFGEFPPSGLSPYGYNETVAQEYFPITEANASQRGYRWGDVAEKQFKVTMRASEIPDVIDRDNDSILDQVIQCEHDGKCLHPCSTAFRIVPQELEFYRKFSLPIPHLCFNCRHYERLKFRYTRGLWHRKCMCAGKQSENGIYKNIASHFHGEGKCPNEFETSYAPDRPELVYCEKCYQTEIS